MNKNRKYVHNILKQYKTPDFIPKAFMLLGEYFKKQKVTAWTPRKKKKKKKKKMTKWFKLVPVTFKDGQFSGKLSTKPSKHHSSSCVCVL